MIFFYFKFSWSNHKSFTSTTANKVLKICILCSNSYLFFILCQLSRYLFAVATKTKYIFLGLYCTVVHAKVVQQPWGRLKSKQLLLLLDCVVSTVCDSDVIADKQAQCANIAVQLIRIRWAKFNFVQSNTTWTWFNTWSRFSRFESMNHVGARCPKLPQLAVMEG